jgi:DNA-binding GntR family transcriptional regulator
VKEALLMPIPHAKPDYRDLSDWVVIQILDAVREGTILPGERLIEGEIATRFGVSRAPVRDAIHKLDRLGFVVQDGPRTTRLRSWSARDVVELLEMFDWLVALSARLAATRITDEDIQALEQVIEETRRAIESDPDDFQEQMTLDVKFHVLLARSSGNSQLEEMIAYLWLPQEVYHQQFLSQVGRAYSLHEHSELLQAVRSGNPDTAEACARRHALEGLQGVMEAIQK